VSTNSRVFLARRLGELRLKWMYNYAFSGEVVLGALVMTFSLHLLSPVVDVDQMDETVQESPPRAEPSNTTTNLT